MSRVCGTPGCTYPDHHIGPHSNEETYSRRPQSEPATLDIRHNGNQFQINAEFCQQAFLDYLRGNRLYTPGRQRVKPRHLNHGQSGFLLLSKKNPAIAWSYTSYVQPDVPSQCLPEPSEDLLEQYKEHISSDGHPASQQRMIELAKCMNAVHISGDGVVLSLDGDGSNKMAFQGVNQTQTFITAEINPTVCLAQKILFRKCHQDKDIIFTPQGIESLIIDENDTLTNDMKLHITALNLDYCGGFYGSGTDHDYGTIQFRSMLSRLPNLVCVMVTLSKRRHPQLLDHFDRYAPTPFGFREVKVFTENARVVTKLYVRKIEEPRTFMIPQSYFANQYPRDDDRTFLCIAKEFKGSTVTIFCPEDNTETHQPIDDVFEFQTSDENLEAALNELYPRPCPTMSESMIYAKILFDKTKQSLKELERREQELDARERELNERDENGRDEESTFSTPPRKKRFRCSHCGQEGHHYKSTCPNKEFPVAELAQTVTDLD